MFIFFFRFLKIIIITGSIDGYTWPPDTSPRINPQNPSCLTRVISYIRNLPFLSFFPSWLSLCPSVHPLTHSLTQSTRTDLVHPVYNHKPMKQSPHPHLFTLILCLLFCSFFTQSQSSIAGHGQSASASYLEVLEPTTLYGQRIPMQLSMFSIIPPQTIGLTANIVLMDPLNGCGLPKGKDTSFMKESIVLIERGDCQFIDKAKVVDEGGGVGFIISNVVDTVLPVPVASPDGSPPEKYLSLPGGAILGRDGNFLKALLRKGVPVRVKMVAEGTPRAL